MKTKIFYLTTFFCASFVFQSCQYEQEAPQPNSNLKSGYHFDDFSNGLALDFSSSLYGDILINQKNNAVPFKLKLTKGKYDNAILFNDSTANLYIPHGFGKFPKGFTIDFWINLDVQPTSEYRNIMAETQAGSATTFRIGIENNYLSFDFLNNPVITPTVKSSTMLSSRTWYHVAVTYDGEVTKLFINGKLDDSNAMLMGMMDSWNGFNLGYFNDYYGHAKCFYGALDELRIWNKKYNDEEIKNYLMVTYNF